MAGAGARTQFLTGSPTGSWIVPARSTRPTPPEAATATAATVIAERDLEALHPRCFGWALACCDWNPDEAADVVQTAYLKLLEGRARFEGRSALSTFVFGVIRRTAAERRRLRVRRRRLLRRHAADQPGADGAALPDPAPAREAARLREALSALPARQREVLHLVFYEDLSIREAGEVMNVSLGTARVHYDRGKKRLRRLLAPERDAARDRRGDT